MTNQESNNKIDLTFLKAEIGDEKEFVVNLLTVFKKAMNTFCNLTNEYMTSENVLGIKDQSHKLAPACQMLGLEYLHQLLKKIESNATNTISVEQLKIDLDQALHIIKKVAPQIDHMIENYE